MRNPAKRRGNGARRGSRKSALSNQQPTDTTTPESSASSTLASEKRMMARALARVLGGEIVPDDPNINPEHRRIFHRPGDNESSH
jgi:hypothetical protein